MQVSADALFHFTKDLNTIKNILQNGFYPRYCMEKKEFLSSDLQYTASPMVCFCDIPISLIKTHVIRYGEFGIGIDKQWGSLLRIHPVSYVFPQSAVSKYINFSYAALKKNYPLEPKPIKELNDLDFLHGDALNAIHYLKPYVGKNWTGKSFNGDEICFYDEREWRYIPDQPPWVLADVPRFLSKDQFMDMEEKDEYNRRLEMCRIPINDKVIKYIVVSKEREMTLVEFIMSLKDTCGHELTQISKNIILLG